MVSLVSVPLSFFFSICLFVGQAATEPTMAAAKTAHEARMVKPGEVGLRRDG